MAQADLSLLSRAAAARDAAMSVLGRGTSDVYYIQDPATGRLGGSRPHGGGDSGSSGGTSSSSTPSTSSTSAAKEGKKKKVESIDDFEKKGVRIADVIKQDKKFEHDFLKNWNVTIGVDPEDFKKQFLGGTEATMFIGPISDNMSDLEISGTILHDGSTAGSYRRYVFLDGKRAVSSYLNINRDSTKHGIGKKILAGNMDFYKQVGIERVDVHANIDVGGYAWAKFGYVPTQQSWNQLRLRLSSRLEGPRAVTTASGNTYTPESWEEISEVDQETIRDSWFAQTRDEFIESEIRSWRDSGIALDDAKVSLANAYSVAMSTGRVAPSWAQDAVGEVKNELGDSLPYTTDDLLKAISVKYDSNGSGSGDLTIDFDDSKLQEPLNAPFPDQMNLPGVPPEDLSQRLTEDMRNTLTEALTKAFDDAAYREDVEPPDYIAEQASEFQQEYWDGLDNRERYRAAERYRLLPEYPTDDVEDAETPLPLPKPNDPVVELLKNPNPKAIWALADSPRGKELLLNTDWEGSLNLKDPDSVARFDAYVRQTNKPKQKAAA